MKVSKASPTDVVDLESVHIVQIDVTEFDVRHAKEALPKSADPIENAHVKEVDEAIMKAVVRTGTEDPEAVIVTHPAQVQLETAVTIITVKGMCI